MAAPKELKSPGSAGKPQNIKSPVPSGDAGIPDISAGLIPDISAGLVQNVQPTLYGSSANPQAVETPDTIAARQITQSVLDFGAPVVETAAQLAPAVSGLGFLPGVVASAGVGAAASALFDNLRNYTITDPSKKITQRQIFDNALMAAGFGAVGEVAGRGIMAALFRKAKSTGNEEVAKLVEQWADESGGGRELLETAEQLGMSIGGAKITLTPQEAFPLNPQAAAISQGVLNQFPGLGAVRAFKLGKIKQGLLDFAGSFKGANISNIKTAASTIADNYGISIKQLQDQVNTLAEGSAFRNEAEQMLSLMRSEIESVGGKFEGDVLTFADEPGIAAAYNIYKQLRSSLSIPAQPEQYSKIVGVDGKPFVAKEAVPEGINPLSINDINRVLRQLKETAAYQKEPKDLTSSNKVARKIYNQVVSIRDAANISVAEKSGNDALARELRSQRDIYSNNIEGLRIIQENLEKEPTNVIPYLIRPDNPAEVSKILSVLTDEQKVGLKGEFLRSLIDPVSQGAKGLIPDSSFKSSLDQLYKYDPKILSSIYSPGEFNQITKFLKLGERVEMFGGSVKAEKAAESLMDKMFLMMANPKVAAMKIGLDKLVETMSSNSNVRTYLDARLYMAGLKKAGDVSSSALELAEKKISRGAAFAIRATPQAVMQGAKELLRERSQK